MAMDNSQFDAIMRTYDRLRAQHNHELTKRFEEIYTKIPEYKAQDESLPSISISQEFMISAGYEARNRWLS